MVSKSLEKQTRLEVREGKAQNRRHKKVARERAKRPPPDYKPDPNYRPPRTDHFPPDPDLRLPDQVRRMVAVAHALEPKEPNPEDLRVLRLQCIKTSLQTALAVLDELF